MFWKSRKPEQPEDESLAGRVNRLETAVERLQLDHAERQVAVLNGLEKVMTQLRARDRKREAQTDDEDAPGSPIGYEPVVQVPPRRKLRAW